MLCSCEDIAKYFFATKCLDEVSKIQALEFEPDHAFVFVSKNRKYSISCLVNQLKGYSSKPIRRNLPEDVIPFLWSDSFW